MMLSAIVVLAGISNSHGQSGEIVLNRGELHKQAVAESLKPIRPGVPGKTPFWNPHAVRFIHAPAFDLPEVDGAARYELILRSETDNSTHTFFAEHPWAPLSPVWEQLPTGTVQLLVRGIGEEGDDKGVSGKRRFRKAAAFRGPYYEAPRSYGESARMGLDYLFHLPFVQEWRKSGEPDPDYVLYGYPSKIVGAVIRFMLMYAERVPEKRDQAMEIAEAAARYLIATSEPEGAPFEFMPQTYANDPEFIARLDPDNDYHGVIRLLTEMNYRNHMMLIYPAGVGHLYLDLFRATGSEAYFEAALRIADTYVKTMDEKGRWPLKIYRDSGKPVSDNFCHTHGIRRFFVRLREEFGKAVYDDVIARVFPGKSRSFETFNWEGQFEDIEPADAYVNHANSPALSAVNDFLNDAERDPEALAKAREALAFAEDQFIVWEKPMNERGAEGWITPSALEQYRCYLPIDASATSFIRTYRRMYEVTGEKIHLARFIALANAVVASQDPETGNFPTFWFLPPQDAGAIWFNCAISTVRAMESVDRFLREKGLAERIKVEPRPGSVADYQKRAMTYPDVQGVLLDGKPLPGFAPRRVHYLHMSDHLPEVKVLHEDPSDIVVVTAPETVPGHLYITARKNVPDAWALKYHVTVVSPPPPLPDRSKVSVVASGHDGNIPENTLDGDLSTRWSAYGKGQWIQYDLGEARKVKGLMMSWTSGTLRESRFSVEVSLNSEDWKTVFDGSSSMDIPRVVETFDFVKPTLTRFLRITAYGNSENNWNSISETAFRFVD